MRKVSCGVCGKVDVSLNESIKIDGVVYCFPCVELHFPDQSLLDEHKVEKEIDPTVCSFCNKDNFSQELEKMATYPVCRDCEVKMKDKAFPLWVKGFLLALSIIIFSSFVWNWKYYVAYNNIKKSNSFAEIGDYKQASILMESASKTVPEVPEISALTQYYKGIDYLSKDKCSEAIIEFNKCKDKLSFDYYVDNLLIQARIGDTFEKKDYEGFLKASLDNLQIDTTIAYNWSGVASAYSCIYAKTRSEESKIEAMYYLKRARNIDNSSADAKMYYNLIEYRLETGILITKEDFFKQFPNGWTKN